MTAHSEKVSPFYIGGTDAESATARTGVASDVEVGKRTPKRRAARQRLLEIGAAFEALSDGVAVMDRDGRILRLNGTGQRLLGPRSPADAQESLRQTATDWSALVEMCDEEWRPLPLNAWPHIRIVGGENLTGDQTVDVQVRTYDGRERIWNVGGSPIRDGRGVIVGGVAIIRDVTERKQFDHETTNALLSMAEVLVERERGSAGEEIEPAAQITARRIAELTRQVIGCQRVTITAIEAETEIMRPMAAVGLTPEMEQFWNAGGQRHEMTLTENMATDLGLMARLRAGQVQVIDVREPRYQGIGNPYGTQALMIAPMRVGERLVGLLALDYTDTEYKYTADEIELVAAVAKMGALVIERERLERERGVAATNTRALRETNRLMDEFLSVASHELRTPLTSLLANVQLSERRLQVILREPETLSVEQLLPLHGLLERAERQAHLLARLVNDLVDVSRIGNNKLELRLDTVNLAEIIAEMVREQQLAWPLRPIAFEAPQGEVTVAADADRIGQVVTNYLTNALKYSDEDRPVVVSLRVMDGVARVEVRDEGPGLTAKQAKLVWERFHRVPGIYVQSGSGVGLGLGLHISRTIVERHAGQVGVESELGNGSTFWFTLPMSSARGDSETAANV
ncbi:MAG TPA: ATP-binding protein [Ktedonobacterales bacterium]|nr:ATP-binding protein [Ktedonobacterales bacterium]